MEEERELLHRTARKSFVCFDCIESQHLKLSGSEDNDDDKEFEGDNEEDINLEDKDTDVEDGEVDDLNEDMARKCSTTPTHTHTRTPKAKAKVKPKTIDDLHDLLNKMSLNKNRTDFSMSHSKLHFTYREGAKGIAVYEILAIDQHLLHHVMLKGPFLETMQCG